jgi:hypothetical protein
MPGGGAVDHVGHRVDLVHVVIERATVESGDVSEGVAALARLLVDAEDHRERVDLSFAGWDDTPADLWEIDEVRTYVARLDEQFPFWLYFLSKETGALLAIAACLTRPAPTPRRRRTGAPGVGLGDVEVITLLEERWFPGLNALAERTGLTRAEIALITDRTARYFKDGPLPPGA